jgi:hypothetical protein
MHIKNLAHDSIIIPREEVRHLFDPAITTVTLVNWEKRGLLVPIKISGNVFYERIAALETVENMKKYGSTKKKR